MQIPSSDRSSKKETISGKNEYQGLIKKIYRVSDSISGEGVLNLDGIYNLSKTIHSKILSDNNCLEDCFDEIDSINYAGLEKALNCMDDCDEDLSVVWKEMIYEFTDHIGLTSRIRYEKTNDVRWAMNQYHSSVLASDTISSIDPTDAAYAQMKAAYASWNVFIEERSPEWLENFYQACEKVINLGGHMRERHFRDILRMTRRASEEIIEREASVETIEVSFKHHEILSKTALEFMGEDLSRDIIDYSIDSMSISADIAKEMFEHTKEIEWLKRSYHKYKDSADIAMEFSDNVGDMLSQACHLYGLAAEVAYNIYGESDKKCNDTLVDAYDLYCLCADISEEFDSKHSAHMHGFAAETARKVYYSGKNNDPVWIRRATSHYNKFFRYIEDNPDPSLEYLRDNFKEKLRILKSYKGKRKKRGKGRRNESGRRQELEFEIEDYI